MDAMLINMVSFSNLEYDIYDIDMYTSKQWENWTFLFEYVEYIPEDDLNSTVTKTKTYTLQ